MHQRRNRCGAPLCCGGGGGRRRGGGGASRYGPVRGDPAAAAFLARRVPGRKRPRRARRAQCTVHGGVRAVEQVKARAHRVRLFVEDRGLEVQLQVRAEAAGMLHAQCRGAAGGDTRQGAGQHGF